MKKQILTITILAAGAVSMLAQGVVKFSNDPGLWSDGIDRLVYEAPGVPVTSDTWTAQLQEDRGGVWTDIGGPEAFYGDFGGAYPSYAGWWPGPASDIGPLSVPAGTATSLRIGINTGAEVVYTPAFSYTMSNVSPLPPDGTFMNNFRAFTVPEPSTIALGVLGLGALLLFRRRK